MAQVAARRNPSRSTGRQEGKILELCISCPNFLSHTEGQMPAQSQDFGWHSFAAVYRRHALTAQVSRAEGVRSSSVSRTKSRAIIGETLEIKLPGQIHGFFRRADAGEHLRSRPPAFCCLAPGATHVRSESFPKRRHSSSGRPQAGPGRTIWCPLVQDAFVVESRPR